MTRQIVLNAFDMNCVGHQSPGLWRHPRDQSMRYADIHYWTTPVEQCLDGRTNVKCTDYSAWTTAWQEIKG